MARIIHDDLSRKVYEILRDRILDSKLQPGEKLFQEKTAVDLGVSRMPLHRAFQMLENDMLVEQKPRRGFFVRSFEGKEMLEVFECREVLEGLAARKAAMDKDHKTIAAELNAIFEPYSGKKRISSSKYRASDRMFHRQLMDNSGSDVLQKLNAVGHFQLHAFTSGLLRPPSETLPEHVAIIDAIRKGKPAEAEVKARIHIRRSYEVIGK